MTSLGLRPYAYTRLARRSRWRVAIAGSLVVAGFLVFLATGAYVSTERAAYHRLEGRLQRLAGEAQHAGEPGGYLVFDERDHLLSTAPPAVSPDGDSFQIVPDPVLGTLAVLRMPVTSAGPHMVAITVRSDLLALDAVRRTLIGMTLAGTLATLLAGYLLAGLVLRPLDDAVRERSEFVAFASHQLRTPLSIIRTSVELARAARGMTPAESMDAVLTQAQRMEVLAARLSALARVESGQRPATAPTDVSDVAAEAIGSMRLMAEQADVSLSLEAAEPQWVRGKPVEIAEMLAAVVENAIKFSPRGGAVIVRVRPERRCAVLEVADQGPGIAAEDLPHVAKPFFQARGARGGYGLGLPIARAVVEAHGGRLSITSTPGHGTTVRMILPACRPSASTRLGQPDRGVS